MTVYENKKMLTARGVILTLKQDVQHDVCLTRRTAVAAPVCQQLQWLMINVHGTETVVCWLYEALNSHRQIKARSSFYVTEYICFYLKTGVP